MIQRKRYLWWLLLIAGLVAINFLASLVHTRYDLTEDKRYTLTPTTRALLRDLTVPISIDVFLKGDMQADFRRLGNSAQEFVSSLREASPSKVRYRFINPLDEARPGLSWGDSLQALGASPINLSVQVQAGQENKILFPYAIVHQGGQMDLVNLFPTSKRSISAAELNNAEAMMEYNFVKVIDQMAQPSRPMVAYAIGNGEPVGPNVIALQHAIDPESMPEELQQFFPAERSRYRLGLFNLKTQPAVPDTFKTLIIVKPDSSFSESEKLKIDQYVMRGGRVLWFVDNLYAEPDSLSMGVKGLIAYERGLNIGDLLFNYGVRINPDLLMDLQCGFLPFAVGGTAEQPQYEFLHWNYYPLFEARDNHTITRNLGLVAGRFVNSIDTVEKEGLRKTFLLQSSANSRTISSPALISPNENRNTPQDQLFRQKDIPAAVLVEGRFNSLYKGRLGQPQRDSLAAYGGFRQQSEENKMIVVADGDIVLNDVSRQGPLALGRSIYTEGSQYEYQFANRDFLLNCLEYLTSKGTIMSTRNKEIVLRLLDPKRTQAEKTKWQLINIVLPIVLVILFGLIYQQVRRYRFAH